MATYGLKKLYWAPMETEPDNALPTYGTGKSLGRAVSLSVTINTAEGTQYSDDAIGEYANEFLSGDFSAEADNITLEDQAMLYGATYINGELQNGDDNAPYGGIAGYQVLQVHGQKKYRAWFYTKLRAGVPDHSGNTKQESISFGTEPIKGKIMLPNYGKWRYMKEFDNEPAADAYCQTKLGVGTWHAINVQVNGADGTEGATPEGTVSVAAGEDYEIVITGTPTKLYDNGVDKTTQISAGVYTIADVDADHNIAIIF